MAIFGYLDRCQNILTLLQLSESGNILSSPLTTSLLRNNYWDITIMLNIFFWEAEHKDFKVSISVWQIKWPIIQLKGLWNPGGCFPLKQNKEKMRRMLQISFVAIDNKWKKTCYSKYWVFFLNVSLYAKIEQSFILLMFSRPVVSNVSSLMKKLFYMGKEMFLCFVFRVF